MQKTEFEQICKDLRCASYVLNQLSENQKNLVLECLISEILVNVKTIKDANEIDVQNAISRGLSEEMIDRLRVDDALINSEINAIKEIIKQNDPTHKTIKDWKLENGIKIKQITFPLGVISIIYESRPAVTIDAFALAFKSGNAILLRGSKTAIQTNLAFFDIIKTALSNACVKHTFDLDIKNSAYLMPESLDHSDVDLILNARGLIDCVLPRGGKNLIENVIQNAKIPTIETGEGICHLYVDKDADLEMALNIAKNAKLQRPSVCNSLECIVIHNDIANKFIPLLLNEFSRKCDILLEQNEENYAKEWLSLKLSVKFVNSFDEAVQFINTHNTKHSETIVTNNLKTAKLFMQNIDAACVYHNASTRFTDGGQFGFGAELGISTQKLHIRGPMGINALVTYKYVLSGDGQIRH